MNHSYQCLERHPSSPNKESNCLGRNWGWRQMEKTTVWRLLQGRHKGVTTRKPNMVRDNNCIGGLWSWSDLKFVLVFERPISCRYACESGKLGSWILISLKISQTLSTSIYTCYIRFYQVCVFSFITSCTEEYENICIHCAVVE